MIGLLVELLRPSMKESIEDLTRFVGFTSASSDCEHFQPHTRAFAFIPQATIQATCYEHLLHH